MQILVSCSKETLFNSLLIGPPRYQSSGCALISYVIDGFLFSSFFYFFHTSVVWDSELQRSPLLKAIKETVFDRYKGMMKEIMKKRSKVDSTHLFLVTETVSSVKPAHLTNGAGVSRAFID